MSFDQRCRGSQQPPRSACLTRTWSLLLTLVLLLLPARPPSPSASDASIGFLVPTPGGSLQAKSLASHWFSSFPGSADPLLSLATLPRWPQGPGLHHDHPVEPLLSCVTVARASPPSWNRAACPQGTSQMSGTPGPGSLWLSWEPPPHQLPKSCLMLHSHSRRPGRPLGPLPARELTGSQTLGDTGQRGF